MILFDTDTFTYLSYGNENIRHKMEETGDEQFAIAVITRAEVLRGRTDSLLKAANEEELRKAAERFGQTEELLADFLVVGIDDNAIQRFGKLIMQKNLKKMGRPDMLIACIALANDALLVTRNTKDYERVAGLRMANWVD
jgi:tRNA(fMet)-specific endonuclease VapC